MIKNIKQFLFIAALLLIAAGAQPTIAAVYQWSTTAASNATADPNINWAEGMSPSSVNDSARAMMAQIARYRNDIGARTATTGTASSYAFATSSGYPATPPSGTTIAFFIHATNNAGATLQVDGGNTYPIVMNNTPVPAGSLLVGTPYRVSFDGATWELESAFGNPYNIPLGGYLYTSVPNPPNANFLQAVGGCISRTTYAAYFALVGTTYGVCDGTTTFGTPDLRGRVPAMLDGGTNRLSTAAQGCGVFFNTLGTSCGSESATLTAALVPTLTSVNPSQSIAVHPGGSSGNVSPQLTAAANVFVASSGNYGGGGQRPLELQNVGSVTNQNVYSANNSITVTSSGTGGGSPVHKNVQPTYAVNVFVRIF